MKIGDRIREAREKKGIAQKELAKMIGKSPTAMNNYEKHSKGLDPDIIAKLIGILDITPNQLFQDFFDESKYSFDEEEYDLVFKYRALDYSGKCVVKNNIEAETARVNDELIRERKISRPYFRDLTSYKDNNTLEASVQRLNDTVYNQKADCVVRMYDESMEPFYPKGCRLLVQNSNTITNHETGVFLVGDQILIRTKGKDTLKAKNSLFPEIPLSDQVVVLGRVLGRYKP